MHIVYKMFFIILLYFVFKITNGIFFFYNFLDGSEVFDYGFTSSENEIYSQRLEFMPYQEQIHKCPSCQFSSTDSQELVKHVLIHRGEKPYHCPLCPKTFKMKHHVQEHLRTHTGNKRYKCQKCNNAYTKKMFLISHYQKYHPE